MPASVTTRISVVGTGLVGKRHIDSILAAAGTRLASIVEPGPEGKALAERHGVSCFDALDTLFAGDRPDAIILATPNSLHVDMALACISEGIPVLVEKPLATTLAGAETIHRASVDAGVPVLVGHHRRHNPIIAKARAIIADGKLGALTTIHGSTWFYKHDSYFDVGWRTQPGAGPVFINLIHDIDVIRFLCGEIVEVHAMASNRVRGHAVEDTAAIVMAFDNGALGTLSVSDTTVAPWSWELTARENPAYPATDQICYQIGGTAGSLSLPHLSLWTHPHERSWWAPISETKVPCDFADPLVQQVQHLADVANGNKPPLVTAWDGYTNQAVLEAIVLSASEGKPVKLR